MKINIFFKKKKKSLKKEKRLLISFYAKHVQCRIQEAWGWCTGMTQRDGMGMEVGGGSGWGTHVHPWRMHIDVWQNKYNIVISLKLK